MTVPQSNTRRLERLERQLDQQDHILQGLLGRLSRAQGQRWHYLAKTAKLAAGTYPGADGDNTFGLIFLDREYTATEGAQAVTDHDRSDDQQAIGRTINGQWVCEGEVVSVFPSPPVPGTSGKGRWSIVPHKTHYWGKLKADLEQGSSAVVDVWTRLSGAWADSTFDQTVHDRLLPTGESLLATSWVEFAWETNAWIVRNADCGPEV